MVKLDKRLQLKHRKRQAELDKFPKFGPHLQGKNPDSQLEILFFK